MTDHLGEAEEVHINGAGIVASIGALVDHLASLDITSREAFAAHLRTASTEEGPELGKQLLALAGIVHPQKNDPFQLIVGGKPDDEGPEAA